MPRACGPCTHPERPGVDRALVVGESLRNIAERFGTSVTALHRHKGEHLPAAMTKAKDAEDIAHAIDVVAQLKAINAASLAVLKEARQDGQGELALKAVDRVQRQIELQAKLLGELDDRPQLNVLISVEWLAVRSALLEALQAFPDARTAVSARLVALEAGW